MFLLEKQVRGDINPKAEMFYWETFLRRDWPRVQINIWARSSGTLESRYFMTERDLNTLSQLWF